FFFQAEDGIRDFHVTGVQTCALPISLAELSAALHSKAISSVELTEHYLARIQQLDGAINSFITVTPELALEQARAADARLADGKIGRASCRERGQRQGRGRCGQGTRQ